jgi:hypothetical protein
MKLLSTTIRKYGFKSLPTIKSEKNIQEKSKKCETMLVLVRVQYNSTSMKSELKFLQRIAYVVTGRLAKGPTPPATELHAATDTT